jgi:hypothetical protein
MGDNQVQGPGQANQPSERVAVPEYVYPYRAGVVGGLLGGAVLAIVALIAAPLIGRSIWFPLNVAASAFVPDLQGASLATLNTFMLDTFIVGIIIHLVLSIAIGLAFALLLPTLPGPPLVWSVVIGAIMWAVALFLALPVLNPMMGEMVNPLMGGVVEPLSFIIANIAYTVTLGWWVSRYEKVRVGGPKPPTRLEP